MELGDLATWVTGLFTAGALALGAYVLFRDSRRERSKQAESIIVYMEGQVDQAFLAGGPLVHTVHVRNMSDRPIFSVRLHDCVFDPDGQYRYSTEHQTHFLEPGQRISFKWLLASGDNIVFWAVEFTDVARQPWFYDMAFERPMIGGDRFERWKIASEKASKRKVASNQRQEQRELKKYHRRKGVIK